MYLTAAIVALVALCGIGIWKTRKQPAACPKCMAHHSVSTDTCGVCGYQVGVKT